MGMDQRTERQMPTAPTRFNGTLKKWNVDRGFGFVVVEHGDQELFVHVSAFPRDGRQPFVGEPLSFEMEQGADGRQRAVRVRRPGGVPATPSTRSNRGASSFCATSRNSTALAKLIRPPEVVLRSTVK